MMEWITVLNYEKILASCHVTKTLYKFLGTRTNTRQTRQHWTIKPVLSMQLPAKRSECSPIRWRDVFRAEFFSPFLRPVSVLLTGILRPRRQSSRPIGKVKQGQTRSNKVKQVKQGHTRFKQGQTR